MNVTNQPDLHRPCSTAVEVLERALDRLRHGWCQNAYARDVAGISLGFSEIEHGCAWCLVGSLYGRGESFPLEAKEIMSRAIGDMTDTIMPHVHVYNDAPGRTQEEVIALVERALELARTS